MAIIPGLLPRGTEFVMRPMSSAMPQRAAFGAGRRRMNRPGSHWALSVTVPPQCAAGAGVELAVDLISGDSQSILLPIPEAMDAGPCGLPTVDGDGQAGSVLAMVGLTPRYPVRKGKFFSVIHEGRRYVHWCTAETLADGDGKASVPIWPMMRIDFADGDVIEMARPMIEGEIDALPDLALDELKTLGLSFLIEETD
ncbi:hypothetical protein JIP62_07055 [Brevundimonas vitis]|uniref:Uncharacterized protein n=1 Tax=Brevundimonas vitisensis TaxID=2800818 RepID=A0ABX7BQG8_9CAUL|nr:hypothetical protein [Brevundimonas vitisensis]QQQ19837.1 hypothetical protein JIP62_07055 [Brevundimonas vitisensis]